jgi:hypothetical protein
MDHRARIKEWLEDFLKTLSGPMTKHFAGEGAGHLTVMDDDIAVHQEVVDADGVGEGLGEGRRVADPLRVEDEDVGRIAHFDPAPLRKPQNGRGERRELPDGFGKGMTFSSRTYFARMRGNAPKPRGCALATLFGLVG